MARRFNPESRAHQTRVTHGLMEDLTSALEQFNLSQATHNSDHRGAADLAHLNSQLAQLVATLSNQADHAAKCLAFAQARSLV